MTFEFTDFFERYHIPYRLGTRGNVEIHCPYCGADDQSMHMSVSTEGLGYRCWRMPRLHYGKNPVRLVAELLHCSWGQASTIVGTRFTPVDDIAGRVNQLLNADDGVVSTRPLTLPKEFKLLSPRFATAKPFFKYLRARGYNDPAQLSERYDLRYCTMGPFKGRIIFPVLYQRQLVCWTGRTIYPSTELRYRALSHDRDKARQCGLPQAVAPISHFLLWYDDLLTADADTIVLTEGPFDALKVRCLGRKHGIVATCFFTAQPTPQQVSLLHTVLPNFRNRVLLLDANTTAMTMHVSRELSSLGIAVGRLPVDIADPGNLFSREQLLSAVRD